ncbi:hypothetical protein RclHR1_01940017 [Rhizophagus clarus]|uniref:MCM domain-containing protein 2 n=1 Tax=Rhizophagus clarus TaxID=94130 RepID=A0A2Z6QPE5_9GLOM|nr:hypothetical protein RclHR1_01940017 [Rhizophagus clarus]GES93672.1 MCM domain-containing protein 2 [Rhizophagus clarus]
MYPNSFQSTLSLREKFISKKSRIRNSGSAPCANKKQESNQAKNNSLTNDITTENTRIYSGTFLPTPTSLRSCNKLLQLTSGDMTPNSISDDTISDIFKERNNLIKNSPLRASSTRRLNIKQDHTPLDTTETSFTNIIQTDQEANIMQIEVSEIDEGIIPAAYPTNSRQEDEKNERSREFREQYSLQKLITNNVNKRKRGDSHDNMNEASKTSKIHPVDKHLLPEPEYMDKLKQIIAYLRRYHMKAIHEAKARSQTIKSQSKSNINRYDIFLQIDPVILLEFDPILGYRLLNNFVGTHLDEDLTEACLFILQSTFGPDEILMAEQVRSKVRLEYLPDLPEYRMDKYLTAFHKTRHNKDPLFAMMRGIVECVWMPIFVTFSRTFSCDNPECRSKSYLHVIPGARTNRVIKRTEDKEYLNTSTSATLHNIDLYCSHCEQEMKEMVVDRVYTIRQRIRLSCVDEDENDGSFTNTIHAFVEDELTNKVEVGQIIEVVGLVGKHFPTLDDGKYCTRSWYDNGLHIEVKNIKRVTLNEHRSHILPDVIVKLQKANLSAWAFTQRLVDIFCDDISPRLTCRKIKLFMLLSLVALSEQSNKQGILPSVHLMILSDGHNPIVPRMIRRVSELKRHEEWTHGLDKKKQPLFIIKDGQNTGKESFFESTILARSRDGMLLVNLDTLSKKDVESLRLVMNKSSKLSVQNRYHRIGVDLNTCCWGWSVAKSFGKRMNSDKGRSSDDEGIDGICNDTIKPIIDTFDLVIHLNESNDSETNGLLVDHLLEQATVSLEERNHKEKLSTLAFEEFKQFIAVASNTEVKLSTECKDILRKYFLTCRKLNGASQGFASSTALLESLLRIASCHAKLCLRSVGSVDDALVSILVIEETLVAKFGSSASVLGFVPLLDDQENIHKLYGGVIEPMFFGNEFISSDHSSMNQSYKTNNNELSETNNLSLEERMFCTLVQNISKADDNKMAKMYQHLTRILHSFGYGYTNDGNNRSIGMESDVTSDLIWDQLELNLNE